MKAKMVTKEQSADSLVNNNLPSKEENSREIDSRVDEKDFECLGDKNFDCDLNARENASKLD